MVAVGRTACCHIPEDLDSNTAMRNSNNTIELNGVWVQALPVPMLLGLRTGRLCPMFCTKLEEPCTFRKIPDDSYTEFPDILGAQKKEPRYVQGGAEPTDTFQMVIGNIWKQEKICETVYKYVQVCYLLATNYKLIF